MDRVEEFFETVKREQTMTLATASEGRVMMRVVSPVYYQGAVLIFTAASSNKYQQLQANPHCCIGAGLFFAECVAEFRGATLLAENEALRQAYSEKFPGAFDEGLAFGGRAAEFLLLKPVRLSGWAFEGGAPAADAIPTIPFEIDLG